MLKRLVMSLAVLAALAFAAAPAVGFAAPTPKVHEVICTPTLTALTCTGRLVATGNTNPTITTTSQAPFLSLACPDIPDTSIGYNELPVASSSTPDNNGRFASTLTYAPPGPNASCPSGYTVTSVQYNDVMLRFGGATVPLGDFSA